PRPLPPDGRGGAGLDEGFKVLEAGPDLRVERPPSGSVHGGPPWCSSRAGGRREVDVSPNSIAVAAGTGQGGGSLRVRERHRDRRDGIEECGSNSLDDSPRASLPSG